MTAYVGSGPYCYASTLATVAGRGWPAAVVETLTGSAFGYQLYDGVPYFDPAGWDPDLGVDQALDLFGWTSERRTYDDGETAYRDLTALAADGPVFVGPLEMGLLLHQPGPDRPLGADHFVTVLAADAEGVLMHDPEGFPYAWLPKDAFIAAWASPIAYCVGRFPLRTAIRPVAAAGVEAALAASLPRAAVWAAAPENAAGLRDLAGRAAAGLDDEVTTVLADFSLRLAARRRVDAAQTLRPLDAPLAGLLDR
ncbi:hypothetical protein [Jiangella muralis]|uniref:hypothetical protein n=1 Tax=Jiangella muralis TaxID=702383 RepID=UPI00069DCAB9|nr:hypothetical protein [Jiangella muralis]